MVCELSVEVCRRIVELWLDGNNLREIQAKTGVSLGAISSLVNQEKRRIPDIEELRKLNRVLKKADGNMQDALRGAVFLEKLNPLNIQTNSIPGCIRLFDKYGEHAGELAR